MVLFHWSLVIGHFQTMFSPALQNILALALVACAALYLAWQVVRRKKAGGCGSGCGHCGTSRKVETPQLIRLDALTGANGSRSEAAQRAADGKDEEQN